MTSSSALQGTQQHSPSTAEPRALQEFPTGQALLDCYGPMNLIALTQPQCIDDCYIGKAPTLVDVANCYGMKYSIKFLMLHIIRIVERIGGNEKMSSDDIEELAQQLYAKCVDLKLTEMMLFFRRLLDGDYGRTYGAPRVLYFMDALRTFRNQRYYALLEFESKERERERDRAAKRSCTYQEYLKMKAAKEAAEKAAEKAAAEAAAKATAETTAEAATKTTAEATGEAVAAKVKLAAAS